MLGIMIGRLSPPINDKIQAFNYKTWRDELKIAKSFGFECVEWIFELENMHKNPIFNESGINELIKLSQEEGIKINSMVADNFLFERLYGDQKEVIKAKDHLAFLIDHAHKAKIKILEIPLMGHSSIRNPSAQKQTIKNLREAIQLAQKSDVILALELDLNPGEFRRFIDEINQPNVRVNYDMGNSAMFGYNPREEIKILGDYIVNVHIKDGLCNGSTVPLGEGDTNFETVFEQLRIVNYEGDYIFQTAREDLSLNSLKTPIESTIRKYLDFMKPIFSKYNIK